MLRITEQRRPPAGPITLVVEGRLAGPWVDELRSAAKPHQPTVALDLAGVSYADEAGLALLNQLVADGAEVVATNAYVSTLLATLPGRA
jgi:ABC-type transporter Mla MlaB component